MANNEIKKVFYGSATWVAPAGVTYITINPTYKMNSVLCDSYRTFIKSFNNSLYAFGYNVNGNLGAGYVTPASVSSPVSVLGPGNFTRIDSNGSEIFSFGMSNTNLNYNTSSLFLYSWGGPNTSGQLGNGTVVRASTPTQVLGSMKFYDFQAGGLTYTLALNQKNRLYSWGNNSAGQLGVGDIIPRSSPVAVLGSLNVSQYGSAIGGNYATSFLITTSNKLYTWGENSLGMLGLGDIVNRSSPVLVTGDWSKVLMRGSSTYGIQMDGNTYSWGYNNNGQLGIGNLTTTSTPTLVSGSLKFVDIFVCGYDSTYGLTEKGKLYSWGYNNKGQLGIGNTTTKTTPTPVLGDIAFSKIFYPKISASFTSMYGIDTQGNLYAWGDNSNGQLGVGDLVARSSPTLVLGGLKWVHLSVGGRVNATSVVGVTTSGEVYSWGTNNYGQLGVGDVVNKSYPVAILGSGGADILQASQFGFSGQIIKLKVTPGQSYNILFSKGVSYFYNTPISTGDLEKIEISYFI